MEGCAIEVDGDTLCFTAPLRVRITDKGKSKSQNHKNLFSFLKSEPSHDLQAETKPVE